MTIHRKWVVFFLLFSVFVHPSNFPSFVKLILWKVTVFSSNKWKNNPKLIHVDSLRHSCYLLAKCMAIKVKLYKEAYFKAITYDNTIRCLSAFSVIIDYLIQTNYNSINEASFVTFMKVSYYRFEAYWVTSIVILHTLFLNGGKI